MSLPCQVDVYNACRYCMWNMRQNKEQRCGDSTPDDVFMALSHACPALAPSRVEWQTSRPCGDNTQVPGLLEMKRRDRSGRLSYTGGKVPVMLAPAVPQAVHAAMCT